MIDRKRKIMVNLSGDAWHGYSTETLWATEMETGHYQVANSPFFARDLSYLDIVSAEESPEGLIMLGVVARSGHSTYRIILQAPLESVAVQNCWKRLEWLGCSYEKYKLNFHLLSVDVPPNVDIHKAYAILESGERSGLWEFEEGYCAHVAH